jgi:acid phosphatase
MAAGAWFASSYGIGYPSQPNYFALWSGSTQGVTSDACPPPGSPFSTANLGQALEAAGKTWRSYAENLAAVGATDCSFDGDASTGLYTRKHAPWTYFSNVDHSNERPYTDLAADLAAGQLPNLAFVLPNNCHNTHDLYVDPSCDVPQGDAWLAANLPPIIQALGPNDLLILTWDEDDGTAGNNILTVFVGPLVLPHSASVRYVTHYTMVRTIADALGVPPPGQSATEFPISDVWDWETPAHAASWGRLKLLYR